jgi:glyoxylase-like metal-dependent hydrolase (beta-lactamase superfamily II)
MEPGQVLQAGRRRWHALAAPGHDPHSLVLFDDQTGVLISADALWENGFGVVFPELEGEDAFDEVARVLDLIGSLGAHWVIPGHGAPFGGVNEALQRARRRLESFRSDPARHARHAAKVLVKYHLMEEQQQPWADFLHWFTTTELCRSIWQRLDRPEGTMTAFAERLVAELLAAGALAQRDGVLHDA